VNKKNDIYRAAIKLFVEEGEQATSMKWIAKQAKCGIGTMYNYFQSKDELINDLYIEIKTKLFTSILTSFNSNNSVKQQFIEVWLRVMNFAVSYPLEYSFLEIFAYSPKISKLASDEVNKLISPLMQIVEKGKKEGIIKDIDTMLLVIFTNGAITSCILNNKDIDENGKKEIALMAWDAIKS